MMPTITLPFSCPVWGRRKNHLICAVMLSLVVLVAFTGCSAVQQGSTPFWEEEYQRKYNESRVQKYGPAAIEKTEVGIPASVYAERINGWPLFYRLGDTMSILWPLFMKTPLGNAVFPVYEYIKEPMRLSLFLYTVGFYADKTQDRSGNYVFPVWFYDRKGEKKAAHLLVLGGWHSSPTRWGNYLIPVWYYRGADGGKDKLFNLLVLAYAESTSDTLEHGVFPVWAYRSNREAKYKKFHYLLFGWIESTPTRVSNNLFPVWFYESTKDSKDQRHRSLFVLPLPAGFASGPDELRHGCFPLYYYKRDKDSSSFLSLPMYVSKEPDSKDLVLGGILYWDLQNGKDRYRSLLWPFTHIWSNERSQGHAVAPLYAWTGYADGGWMFNSLLLNRAKGKTNVLNFGGPLFFHATRGESWYTNLFWPIYQGWGSKDSASHLLLPVGYYREDKEKGRFLDVVGPLLYHSKSQDKWHTSFLFPLYNGWGDKTDQRHLLLPVGYYGKTPQKQAVISPLVSYGKNNQGEGFFNVLGLLFHRGWDKEGFWTWLTPLLGLQKDKSGHTCWAFPLFIQHTGKNESGFYSPVFSYNKSKDDFWWNAFLAGPTYYSTPGTKSYSCLIGIIHYFVDKDKGRCFNMSCILPILKVDRYGFSSIPAGYSNEIPSERETEKELQTALDGVNRRAKEWEEQERKRVEEPAQTKDEKAEPRKMPSWCSTTHWAKKKLGHLLPVVLGSKTVEYTVKYGDSLDKVKDSRKVRSFFTIFPLYFLWSSEDVRGEKESGANLLGILYMGSKKRVEKDGVAQTHVRRRVLYKFVDYRRQDKMTVTDIFPFMTWDRDPDRSYKRFSFIGPVLRRTVAGEKTQWQILGIKSGDDMAVAPHAPQ